MNDESPLVSIVIATRNRKEHVLRALESCFAQTHRPLEVLVYDDASEDDPREAIVAAFPQVRYFRQEQNCGIAKIRNLGFADALGEYVFGIDDDAYYSDPRTIDLVLGHFATHPRAAVIAIPFIEPNRLDPRLKVHYPATNQGCLQFCSFVSCAYAIRPDAALESGGYRDFFRYRGEERDLSIRLLDRGWEIVYADVPPVVHLFSSSRNWGQMLPLGIRNQFLFTILNVPLPFLLPRICVDAINLFRYKLTVREVPWRALAVLRGFAAALRYANRRSAVSMRTYLRFRTLTAHGAEDREMSLHDGRFSEPPVAASGFESLANASRAEQD